MYVAVKMVMFLPRLKRKMRKRRPSLSKSGSWIKRQVWS